MKPAGIDLNFGCPAKVVNRHGGGAALLDQPELLARIVGAVRRAVPAQVPVSAKMRLGVSDASRALECALAIAAGGAAELVVHARTRAAGYRPPVYWDRIAEIRQALTIPVIANGDIWTVADARACRQASGCEMLMIGRGLVCDPGLAGAIRADVTLAPGNAEAFIGAGGGAGGGTSIVAPGLAWPELLPLIHEFWQLVAAHIEPRGRAGRLKQWLNYLRRVHPQADVAFAAVRTLNDPAQVLARLGLVTGRSAPPAGDRADQSARRMAGDRAAHAAHAELAEDAV